MKLEFKPIQLDQHRELCIQFRADSFVVSFGDDKKFYEEDGKGDERYIEWLQGKIAKDPQAAVHVWQGSEVIGQIELGTLRNEPSVGYVSLYYLIPTQRGSGLGAFLDGYVVKHLKSKGFTSVRLSVSPSNASAVAFYKKMGWKDKGPRPGHPEVHFMEKEI
jgi:ribosomal protein S18 acetylase RimI-like enzyme